MDHFRWTLVFQSTPPARGATQEEINRKRYGYISIHAPREGGDFCRSGTIKVIFISIHAPREGGDRIGEATLLK